jgi:hypothetical protein
MSDTIRRFSDIIERAKKGDSVAIVGIRNVLRTVADGAAQEDLIQLAEALVGIRNQAVLRQGKLN